VNGAADGAGREEFGFGGNFGSEMVDAFGETLAAATIEQIAEKFAAIERAAGAA